MPNSLSLKPYQVLVDTKEVLVLQTNAGTHLDCNQLTSDKDKGYLADSFGGFNLGLHVHDDPVKVLANRGQLLALINKYLTTKHLVNSNPQPPAVQAIHWLNQIHSNQVIRIGAVDHSAPYSLSMTPPAADALVTNQSNQALSIMTADCVPIVIFDPSSNQIAAIHAGWKGLANGIIFETVKALNPVKVLRTGSERDNSLFEPNKNADQAFAIDPAGIETEAKPMQAWIGACISQSCYEVSVDVVQKLLAGCQKLGMDIEAIKQELVAEHQHPNKAWLDLPKLAQLQLQQLGIKLESPLESEPASPALACSYADNRYYSYRRKTHLGEKHTGRMALLIVKLN